MACEGAYRNRSIKLDKSDSKTVKEYKKDLSEFLSIYPEYIVLKFGDQTLEDDKYFREYDLPGDNQIVTFIGVWVQSTREFRRLIMCYDARVGDLRNEYCNKFSVSDVIFSHQNMCHENDFLVEFLGERKVIFDAFVLITVTVTDHFGEIRESKFFENDTIRTIRRKFFRPVDKVILMIGSTVLVDGTRLNIYGMSEPFLIFVAFRVYVDIVESCSFAFYVHVATRISLLLSLLTKKLGAAPKMVSLLMNLELLDEEKTVGFYGIKDGDHLSVVMDHLVSGACDNAASVAEGVEITDCAKDDSFIDELSISSIEDGKEYGEALWVTDKAAVRTVRFEDQVSECDRTQANHLLTDADIGSNRIVDGIGEMEKDGRNTLHKHCMDEEDCEDDPDSNEDCKSCYSKLGDDPPNSYREPSGMYNDLSLMVLDLEGDENHDYFTRIFVDRACLIGRLKNTIGQELGEKICELDVHYLGEIIEGDSLEGCDIDDNDLLVLTRRNHINDLHNGYVTDSDGRGERKMNEIFVDKDGRSTAHDHCVNEEMYEDDTDSRGTENNDLSNKSTVSLMVVDLEGDGNHDYFSRIFVDRRCSPGQLKSDILQMLRVSMCGLEVHYLGEVIEGDSLDSCGIEDNDLLVLRRCGYRAASDVQLEIKVQYGTNKPKTGGGDRHWINDLQTVEELKRVLREHYQVGEGYIKLMWAGEELGDETVLGNVGLGGGSMVSLVMEVREDGKVDGGHDAIIGRDEVVGFSGNMTECEMSRCTKDIGISEPEEISANDLVKSACTIRDDVEGLASESLLIRCLSADGSGSTMVSMYEYHPGDTVLDLKLGIKQRLAVEPCSMNLTFNGEVLEDHRRLEEYGVDGWSCLTMMSSIASCIAGLI